ncbi:MAG: isopentenyl-diphosphate Delta-isomerase [Actinophytocola sp.]|nr:isopentenyl-diphosphate Delta-isomerase [Actinophytocola sp.]
MEKVVLVDDDGNRIGTADKATVHHSDTPLHLAFSAYVFNSRGEFLLTRRAASKKTWPNAWTNSCCGHPLPDEELPQAVARRLRDELGLSVTAIDLVLPTFRYRAEMPNGIFEHEMCPVYRVLADDSPEPEPSEVAETTWVPWDDFVTAVLNGELAISPWCHEQIVALSGLATSPPDWRVASGDELPPAARLLAA